MTTPPDDGGDGPLTAAEAAEPFCYLTTRGRVTGREHTIEIWFAAEEGTLYLLAGGGRRADWVRNLLADPDVGVRIGARTWRATATVVDAGRPGRDSAAALVHAKYQPGYGGDLTGWRDTALLVSVALRP